MTSTRSALWQAFPRLLREIGAAGRAWLKREPERRQAALDFVRAHATEGDPASVLAALDRFAREERFLMNVGDEKGPFLVDLVRKAGPEARVLELGSYVGYSAILIAAELGPQGQLVSIDSSDTAQRVSTEMARYAGVGDRVEFFSGGSEKVIPTLKTPFDVVFIDHWKGLYKADAERLIEHELLAPSAVIVADNVGPMFGENPYVPWMQARSDFETQYIESHVEYSAVEDGVLVSRRRPAGHGSTAPSG